MGIPWDIIIDAVITLVTMCLEKDATEADIRARLTNPGIRERWALRRVILRKTDLRGRALHEAINEGMEMLKTDGEHLAEEILSAVHNGDEMCNFCD
jgi:hypothetical protein